MYAVVEIAGQQFKVAKDQRLYVHRLNAKEGDTVNFDNVLLVDNDGKVNVGAPAISGASVSAKVIGHLKGDKVIVFKKKRRKGYQKSNGHRQYLTQIEIQQILEKGAKKATEEKPKAESSAKTESKAEPKAKAAPKSEASEPAKAKTETKAKPETKAKAEPKAAESASKPKAAAPKAESKAKDDSEKNSNNDDKSTTNKTEK